MYIPIIAKSEQINVKTGTIIYTTDVDAPPGILVLTDSAGHFDMMITDQIHVGGMVTVTMKPTKPTGVKKYNVGDTIAALVVIGKE